MCVVGLCVCVCPEYGRPQVCQRCQAPALSRAVRCRGHNDCARVTRGGILVPLTPAAGLCAWRHRYDSRTAANQAAALDSKLRDADAAPSPPKHWPHDEATYTDRNVYDGTPPKTIIGLPGVTPKKIDDP